MVFKDVPNYFTNGVDDPQFCKSRIKESSFFVPIYDKDRRRYAVDDVESLDRGFERQLFTLQNAVYASPDARLVCAGHLPPHQLPLSEDVRSRLLWGPSFAIAPLGEEDRFRELSRQAALRGIVLSPDIRHWMAVHLPRNMRSLTRVLDVANLMALHAKRRVTLPVIKDAAAWLLARRLFESEPN